jgi:carboxylesterase type B
MNVHRPTALCETGCPPSTAPRSEIVEFLRSLPADDLVAKFKDYQFLPVLDRRVIVDVTPRMYERGDYNDCDLIAGCNNSEGEMLYDTFVPKMSAPGEELTVSKAREIISTVVKMLWTLPNGEQSYEAIVDNYVQEGVEYSAEELRKVMAECMGDVLFVIPSIKAASFHSRMYALSRSVKFSTSVS